MIIPSRNSVHGPNSLQPRGILVRKKSGMYNCSRLHTEVGVSSQFLAHVSKSFRVGGPNRVRRMGYTRIDIIWTQRTAPTSIGDILDSSFELICIRRSECIAAVLLEVYLMGCCPSLLSEIHCAAHSMHKPPPRSHHWTALLPISSSLRHV